MFEAIVRLFKKSKNDMVTAHDYRWNSTPVESPTCTGRVRGSLPTGRTTLLGLREEKKRELNMFATKIAGTTE
jgi:hypothetical protein